MNAEIGSQKDQWDFASCFVQHNRHNNRRAVVCVNLLHIPHRVPRASKKVQFKVVTENNPRSSSELWKGVWYTLTSHSQQENEHMSHEHEKCKTCASAISCSSNCKNIAEKIILFIFHCLWTLTVAICHYLTPLYVYGVYGIHPELLTLGTY